MTKNSLLLRAERQLLRSISVALFPRMPFYDDPSVFDDDPVVFYDDAPVPDAATVAETSANSHAVTTLDAGFSDPPTLADLEAVRAKMNELITALRR